MVGPVNKQDAISPVLAAEVGGVATLALKESAGQ
jgi:hypothetical protein